MKHRIFVTMAAMVFAGSSTQAQRRGRDTSPAASEHAPLARSESEKKILANLERMVQAGELYANVPAADGRMLRLLAEAANAKHVVEIGTSTGISGLWFALALERTGGKLTTFEFDPGRAATARKNFQLAGVDRLITLVEGDAHLNVTKLKEPIDIVFIDADKEGYIDYLNKLLPLVKPGGLILAHNVSMIADYIKLVTSKPELDTALYMQGGGLAITLKKR